MKAVETLESLIKKVDEFESYKKGEFQKILNLIDSLEKLEDKIDKFEQDHIIQQRLLKKLESLAGSIDKLVKLYKPEASEPNFPPNLPNMSKEEVRERLRYYTKTAKMIGQVIEIIAGSVELTFNSIDKVIKEKQVLTPKSVEEGQADLSTILESINELIQNLATSLAKNENEDTRDES
ncbi:MAG: hypothetical protein PWQ82_185 [Thermosediminibacterales bacterium]|nr:hypothetical protein [Thermosediminibacterales bacterium]MDK2835350.1 hypothetical protein [Thermosediminibacterales bacterium]